MTEKLTNVEELVDALMEFNTVKGFIDDEGFEHLVELLDGCTVLAEETQYPEGDEPSFAVQSTIYNVNGDHFELMYNVRTPFTPSNETFHFTFSYMGTI
jgi:hypothetical protein